MVKLRRKSKYKNIKTEWAGLTFDSIKECYRYKELLFLERAKLIKNLRRQVPFELISSQKGGIRKELPMKYYADFVYWDNEQEKVIIEDVKGKKTAEYIIKRKLMKLNGHEITEI